MENKLFLRILKWYDGYKWRWSWKKLGLKVRQVKYEGSTYRYEKRIPEALKPMNPIHHPIILFNERFPTIFQIK